MTITFRAFLIVRVFAQSVRNIIVKTFSLRSFINVTSPLKIIFFWFKNYNFKNSCTWARVQPSLWLENLNYVAFTDFRTFWSYQPINQLFQRLIDQNFQKSVKYDIIQDGRMLDVMCSRKLLYIHLRERERAQHSTAHNASTSTSPHTHVWSIICNTIYSFVRIIIFCTPLFLSMDARRQSPLRLGVWCMCACESVSALLWSCSLVRYLTGGLAFNF